MSSLRGDIHVDTVGTCRALSRELWSWLLNPSLAELFGPLAHTALGVRRCLSTIACGLVAGFKSLVHASHGDSAGNPRCGADREGYRCTCMPVDMGKDDGQGRRPRVGGPA